jgi:hypothetical protein
MIAFNQDQVRAVKDAVEALIAREDAARQQQADRVCEAVREWNRGRQRGDLKALVIEALSE